MTIQASTASVATATRLAESEPTLFSPYTLGDLPLKTFRRRPHG